MKVSKHNLMRSVCRASFFDFVKQFWHVVIKEKPVWNWHIQLLCDELQASAYRSTPGT